MLHKKRFLAQLQNNNKNVRFGDFVALVKAYGFEPLRISGSHNIFGREDIPEMVNIQNNKGKAKPYQIKQFLSIVERYNLQMEGANE